MIYSQSPEYKGIGTCILDNLKNLYDKIVCFPSPEKSVRNFYSKNHFVEYPEGTNHFIWSNA